MPRIQYRDLPRFQDLTPEQLKELFGAGPRSYKPSVEALEDRRLMTTFSLLPTLSQDQLAPIKSFNAPASIMQVTPVAQATATNSSVAAPAFKQDLVIDTNVGPLDTSAAAAAFGSLIQPNQQNLVIDTNVGPLDTGAAAIDFGGLSQPTQNLLDYNPQKVAKDAIDLKALKLGAYLGKPVGDPMILDFGQGRAQAYENSKVLLYSPSIGSQPGDKIEAHLVEGLIREEWTRAGGVYKLGYPTSDAFAMAGQPNVFGQFFTIGIAGTTVQSRSLIVWTQKDGAHLTGGSIMEKYLALGGSRYGTPYGAEYRMNSYSIAQDFRYGGPDGALSTIVTSTQTGTHDVAGAIRQSWFDWGAGKDFGTPVTDSTVYSPSGNHQNDIVHFKHDGSGAAIANLAYGPVFVVGNIYTAWMSIGGAEGFGYPTASERTELLGFEGTAPRTTQYSTFLDGTRQKAIYWTENADTWAFHGGSLTHFHVDRGDGQGIVPLGDFRTSDVSPTGFEHVDGPTGSTSSPLTTSSPASAKYQNLTYIQATDGAVLDLLAGLQPSSYTTQGLSADTVWTSQELWSGSQAAGYADYTGIFGNPAADNSFGSIFDLPINPAEGLPVVPPDQQNAPVPEGGDLANKPAAVAAPDLLQAQLTVLDQAVAQNQQDLQGALETQNQNAAAKLSIETEIQTATQALALAQQNLTDTAQQNRPAGNLHASHAANVAFQKLAQEQQAAAKLAVQQAAQLLADLQVTQAQAQAASVAADQAVADLQVHVDQLAAEHADAANQLAQVDANPATAQA